MRILVAGATGAVGRALIPLLVDRGHTVGGLARQPDCVAGMGATAIKADALNREVVITAVREFAPDVVVHQLTSLPAATGLWRFDKAFEQTNRLRTVGTEILLEAAHASRARRLVAQSFCGWPYSRIGGPVKTEADALDPNPPAQLRTTLVALKELEASVTSATSLAGTVLRYGSFYGPHTHLSPGSEMAQQVRKRLFPIIGEGNGVWSFIHIYDAAVATALAAEAGPSGIYNVVDDEPAPVSSWLPELAAVMGARPPRRIPMWLAKLFLPEHLRIMMTEVRGASNNLFKSTFGWTPRFASWRTGFHAEFGPGVGG
ncbi:NAD-dependent epimerase/dehydratase family protein [Bosea vestrisii]|uniref:NAD-dependent epimerase/dehydratase family protein n=1 Tax=Bosea vestrisii TaxID=151416 RepID=A0ABW0HI33_9HYPH